MAILASDAGNDALDIGVQWNSVGRDGDNTGHDVSDVVESLLPSSAVSVGELGAKLLLDGFQEQASSFLF